MIAMTTIDPTQCSAAGATCDGDDVRPVRFHAPERTAWSETQWCAGCRAFAGLSGYTVDVRTEGEAR